MTNAPQAALHAAELLGDVRLLAEQLGRPAGDVLAPLPPTLDRVDSVPALRGFLAAYHRNVFAAQEWPVVLRAYGFAREGKARELAALDREWAASAQRQDFASSSFRVGQRQLAKLRPLRDQRVVQKYLAAIEAGEAHGWHPLVYGVVLAVFNLPLRQGLVNFAAQTLGGFVDAVAQAHRLPERDCAVVLDEICALLPASLPPLPDAALFAAA